MKIVIKTFRTMLYQLWIIIRYEYWYIEHILFHKKKNKSLCVCCNLVPQGIESLKDEIRYAKTALYFRQRRYNSLFKYFMKYTIKPLIINISTSFANIRIIQYVYWKIRIKAIKLRLIAGNGSQTMRKY